uniref:MFS transporter n=1 Tax=Dictyoglomus thermophilum TaxID=14 RepID=A0A7C3RJI7_DICTH
MIILKKSNSNLFLYPKIRWIYIPLGIIIYICLGTVYSWSVFRKPLENLLNITATQSGIPYMLFLFFFSLFMAISGGFINKFKPKYVIIFGGLLVGLGWILSGFLPQINYISITYGIIAGSGVGIVYGVPIAVISRWFPDKRGLSMGLVISGFGLSPLITAPLARQLISLYGPFNTFKILGAIFIFLITFTGFFFKFPSEKLDLKKTQSTQKRILSELNPKEMLKSPKFYGLWFCYLIGTLIGLMIIGISSPVGEELVKLDPNITARLISIFAIFNALGRPLFGWITDKLLPMKSAITSYILVIIGTLLMLLSQDRNPIFYIISFSLFWLILGAWLAIAPASTIILFGEKNYSKNYGIVFTAYGFGAIIGVMISGMLRDIFGSYLYVFYLLIVLGILGIIIASTFLKDKSNLYG